MRELRGSTKIPPSRNLVRAEFWPTNFSLHATKHAMSGPNSDVNNNNGNGAATGAAISTAAAARARAIQLALNNAPKCYARDFNKFKSWVDAERNVENLRPPADGEAPYVTVATVNKYFTDFVGPFVRRQPAGAKKILTAIKYFSENVENVGTPINLETPEVIAALNQQKQFQKERDDNGDSGADPLEGLKLEILRQEERVRLMHHVHKSNHWAPLSSTINSGLNGAIRGCSARGFALKDLLPSFSFGPDEDDPNNPALCNRMGKGGRNKERCNKDRLVCMWRHKHHSCCMVFQTKMLTKRDAPKTQTMPMCPQKNAKYDIEYWEKYAPVVT